jgi:hypothetical protein
MQAYYIDIGYACFAIETDNGICTNAAPIAKWMIGKSVLEIALWVSKKHGEMVELGDENY